jgi:hypothetical protein
MKIKVNAEEILMELKSGKTRAQIAEERGWNSKTTKLIFSHPTLVRKRVQEKIEIVWENEENEIESNLALTEDSIKESVIEEVEEVEAEEIEAVEEPVLRKTLFSNPLFQ